MADFLNEEEQIQALKDWWKKYGLYICVGVFAGVAFYLSWSWVQSQNISERAAAGVEYQAIASALLNGDMATANSIIEKDQYSQLVMPYGYLQKMAEAQLYVTQQKFDKAESSLHQALVIADDPFFRQLAAVRIARLLIAQNKPKEALDLLHSQHQASALTNAEVALVKGDAYLALKDIANARKEYQVAWDALPAFSPQRQLVVMMIADLPKE